MNDFLRRFDQFQSTVDPLFGAVGAAFGSLSDGLSSVRPLYSTASPYGFSTPEWAVRYQGSPAVTVVVEAGRWLELRRQHINSPNFSPLLQGAQRRGNPDCLA
jgi:hypothetical protein